MLLERGGMTARATAAPPPDVLCQPEHLHFALHRKKASSARAAGDRG